MTESGLVEIVQNASRREAAGEELQLEERQESRAALEQLISANYDWVARMCFLELGQSDAAYDAVQEVMLQMAKSLQNFRGDSTLKTWLFTITRRVLGQFRRKETLRKFRFPLGLKEDVSSADFGKESKRRLPDEILIAGEREARVLQAVRKLPEKQRLAVFLHYYEDLPVRQAALQLDCSESTLKTHLFRARKSLEQSLAGELSL